MKTSPCLILLLVFFLGAAAGLRAEVPIVGSVAAGSEKVAGATVRLVRAPSRAEDFAGRFAEAVPVELARTRSDRQGLFELAAPEPGFYRIVVEAEGYLSALQSAEVLTSAPVGVRRIQLVRARRARLKVLAPDGQAVAGARIRLAFDDKGAGRYWLWPEFYFTDAGGQVGLLLPQGEDAQASITAEGWPLHQATLAAGRNEVEARLEPGREQAIEVVDGRRRALANVAVFVPEIGLPLGLTDRAGKVVVYLRPDQKHLGFYDAEGRRSVEAMPAPAPEGTGEAAKAWRIELAEPAVLHGRVTEVATRAPIADAWVYVRGVIPLFTRSDRNGDFELVIPRERRGQLVGIREGYRPATTNVSEVSASLNLGLEPAARIAGRVVDADSTPVAGALVDVQVLRQSLEGSRGWAGGLTDAKGHFLIDDAVAGEPLEIQASFDRLRSPALRQAAIPAGEEAVVELVLPQREAWSCRVVDNEGQPVAGAELLALEMQKGISRFRAEEMFWRQRGRGLIELGRTDASGRLKVTALPAGTYGIGVSARGFGKLMRTSVEVGGDDAAAGEEVELVLRPVVPVSGKVVDAGGRPIAGAQVFYYIGGSGPWGPRLPPGSSPVATTDAKGEFQFAELAAGQRFSLVVDEEGYVAAILTDLGVESEEPLLITLQRGGRLEGQVSAGKSPVAGAKWQLDEVVAGRASRTPASQIGRTDAEGRFAIDQIAAGEYQLRVDSPPGFQIWLSPGFTIEGGATRKLEVELEKAAVVFGRVLKSTGQPVAEAWVVLGRGDHESPPLGHANSDSLGQYSIETAAPGPGWLRVASPSHREVVREVVIEEGRNEINLTLPVGELTLEARVLGPDGEPLAGAEVALAGRFPRQASSQADGAVSFSGLEPDTYFLNISRDGYAFAPRPLEINKSESNLEWQMTAAGGGLRGALLGLDPADADQLMVFARSAEGLEARGTAGLESYQIEGLSAGQWRVFAIAPDRGMVLVNAITLADGEARELPLDFRRLGGPWVGRIPLADLPGGERDKTLFYSLSSGELGPILSGINRDGRIVLRAEPGTYQLNVVRANQPFQTIEIEIGGPSEQVLELVPP